MMVVKSLKEGVEWKVRISFRTRASNVFDLLGREMVIYAEREGLSDQFPIESTTNVWIVEEDDQVAAVGINVYVASNGTAPSTWNWELVSTSEEFGRKIVEKLDGSNVNVHILNGDEEDEDEDDDESDEDEESDENDEDQWSDGMIVETTNEGIVYLLDVDEKPYQAVNARGYLIQIDPSDIEGEADSDDAAEAITEAFELGQLGGVDYEIRRWVGDDKLVRVEYVDGLDFTLTIDGESKSLGEDVDESKLTYSEVFQIDDEVKVWVGPGDEDYVYGTVTGLDDEQHYTISFREDSVVSQTQVLGND